MKKHLTRISWLPALVAAMLPIACTGGGNGGGSGGRADSGGTAGSGGAMGGMGGAMGGSGGVGGQDDCSMASASVDCDDGNPCTQDTCPLGGCVHAEEPNGVACGAGMHCDGTGSCVSVTAIWAQRYGTTNNQLVTGIGLDMTGNPGIVGWYRSVLDFGGGPLPQPVVNDGYAVKLDTTGTFVWNRAFPSPAEVVPNNIQFDDSGNGVVSGSFRQTVDLGGGPLTAKSPNNMFAAKYTLAGAHVWSKRFGETGGEGSLLQSDVDAAGNVYLSAVYSAGVVDFGCGPLAPAGDYDALVAKLDPTGKCVWSKRLGDAGFQQASAIAADMLGNVVIVGILGGTTDFGGGPLTSNGGQDVFVAKLDPSGNHLWSKHFGDALDQFGMNLAVAPDGEIALSGWFAGTLDFGGSPMMSAGAHDGFVARLDANGNHLWSKPIGGLNDDAVKSVAFDKWGNVVMTGFFRNTIDFGAGPMVSAGGTDIVMAKFAGANGKPLWGKRFGDAAEQMGVGIAVDPMGYTFVVGNFDGILDLGLGPLVSAGNFDVFAAKFPP